MSRGDWHIITAFAGLAALFIAFGSGFYWSALNTEQERYQPYRYASDKPSEIDPAAARNTDSQALQYRSPCDQPKGSTESDLCAQWRAAKAAENSALWTKWSVWIGVIGSTLLLWQIILTRKAVEDTSEATEAMRAANHIAANSQRPWISISTRITEFSIPTEMAVSLSFEIVFQNTGNMVAENFYSTAKFIAVENDLQSIVKEWFDKFQTENEQNSRDITIIPNGNFETYGANALAIEHLPWVNKEGYRKDCYFLILAMCKYRLSGESVWRYSMQSFSIGERISAIDRFSIIYDSIKTLSLDKIEVSRMGGSRAT